MIFKVGQIFSYKDTFNSEGKFVINEINKENNKFKCLWMELKFSSDEEIDPFNYECDISVLTDWFECGWIKPISIDTNIVCKKVSK